jgi:hypothetical protein
MYRRPLSVSIVGWLLVLYGLYCFAKTMWDYLGIPDLPGIKATYDAPGHADVKQVLSFYIGLIVAIHIISALFDVWIGLRVLAGVGGARIFYAVACLALLIYEIATAEPLLDCLPYAVGEALIIVVLFLPNARAYFTPEKV